MLKEQPHKGQRLLHRNWAGEILGYMTVKLVEGNLCWCDYDSGERGPFIWRFKDGLNKLVEVATLA